MRFVPNEATDVWPNSVRPYRLTVRTAPFHGVNRGSIPRGVTNANRRKAVFAFVTPSSVWETLRRGIENLASILCDFLRQNLRKVY